MKSTGLCRKLNLTLAKTQETCKINSVVARQPPEDSDPSGGLAAVEAQVYEAARELWGITDKELKEIQRSLAGLGRACVPKVADWLEAGGPGKVRSIGKPRSMVREMLAEELSEIDGWVEPLLHASER